MAHRFSRRSVLVGGVAFAGLAVSSSGARPFQQLAAEKPTQQVTVPGAYTAPHSRPDLNGAPRLLIKTSTGREIGNYLFLAPIAGAQRGAAIFDTAGRLIWYQPVTAGLVDNLQVVRYHGQEMLAWYEGNQPSGSPGYGGGSVVLYDRTYTQTARILGAQGSPIDLHDFVVTPQGTALVEAYVPVVRDLSAAGGAANTTVLDWHLQEVDIASGALLFSWNALDHVGIAEAVVAPPATAGATYDYFHGNSIDVDADSNLIISARNTSAVYKLDRSSGAILWRLRGGTPVAPPQQAPVATLSPVAPPSGNGGLAAPAQDLQLKPDGESFWFQHDVRHTGNGGLSIFDDGGAPFHHNARGLILDVDEAAGTATVRRSYGVGIAVDYMGSVRRQPNGTWLVGWGNVGRLTEFSPTGEVELDAVFDGNSYRALHFPWRGEPKTPPAVAAERGLNDQVTVWASWNGSTAVRSWRVLTGPDSNALAYAGTFPWKDFETAMTTWTADAFASVQALDSNGHVLGKSAPVRITALS